MKKAIIIASILLTGCANTYEPQVKSFTNAFSRANKDFSTRLQRIDTGLRKREREIWVRDKVVLLENDACLELVEDPVSAKIGECRITAADLDKKELTKIETDKLAALAKQLSNYSSALTALTADTTEDRAELEKSVVDAFGSAASFDAILASLDDDSPEFGPFAVQLGEGVGKALALIYEGQRQQALLQTVESADPVIQSASEKLDAASGQGGKLDLNLAYRDIQRARQRANMMIENPKAKPKDSEQAIEDAQKAVSEYRALASVLKKRKGFAAAAKAHTALLAAIRQRRDINPKTATAFVAAIGEIKEIGESLDDTLPGRNEQGDEV